MAINVNDFLLFVNSATNKSQNGGFSTDEFNDILPTCVQQLIDKYIGAILAYQAGQNKNYALIAKYERYLVDIFKSGTISVDSTGFGILPTDWYQTRSFNYLYITQNPLTVVPKPIRETNNIAAYTNSQLNTPSKKEAVCTYINGKVQFAPKDLGSVQIIYYKAAPDPYWGWTEQDNEQVYDAATSVNIPLSPQCNNELAYMLIQYLGLAIKDEFQEQFSQAEAAKE